MSVMTHHDAKSFKDVEFAHGTGAVFVQPGVHTHLMEDMSVDTVHQSIRITRTEWISNILKMHGKLAAQGELQSVFRLTCRAECEPHRLAGTLQCTPHSG